MKRDRSGTRRPLPLLPLTIGALCTASSIALLPMPLAAHPGIAPIFFAGGLFALGAITLFRAVGPCSAGSSSSVRSS